MRANLHFLSHTHETRAFLPQGMGEIANAAKLARLVSGIADVTVTDLFALFGDSYEEWARINMELAEAESSLIERASALKSVRERLSSIRADVTFLMSWGWSMAAVTAASVTGPLVAKLYVHHDNEIIFPRLYDAADLLVTESLLASKRAVAYGIPPWKIVYLPHHYTEEGGVERKGALILGMCCRLEYGKNVEYALEAARQLIEEGEEFSFTLKGPLGTPSPYRKYLEEILAKLEGAPWLCWEREPTPFPEILKTYASFDLCLHLSGAEAGSNTVVEYLALGKPTLVLNASTNPSLFQGGALFVEKNPEIIPWSCPFFIPDFDDLKMKLRQLIRDPTLRMSWGKKAQHVAQERFHPQKTVDRFPLIIEVAMSYKRGETRYRKAVERLFEEDLAQYGL